MVNWIFEILTDLEFRFRENSTLNDDQKFFNSSNSIPIGIPRFKTWYTDEAKSYTC